METVRRLAAYVAASRDEALPADAGEAASRSILDLMAAAALDLDDGHPGAAVIPAAIRRLRAGDHADLLRCLGLKLSPPPR